MSSLRDIQQGFADALFAADGALAASLPGLSAGAMDRIAIYRTAVFANYRNALRASYPVVARLVGLPFFNAAVDAFVRARPSESGDLNVYGDAFPAFLAAHAPAAHLAYLPDVARLEWAQDEAQRAADAATAPESVLQALAATPPERLPALRLALHPSCRLVASPFPVLRIWQVNQPGFDGDDHVSLDLPGDRLLVCREASGVTLTRLPAADHAFLDALFRDATLGDALAAAQDAAPDFDLGAALRRAIAGGAIAGIA